MQRITITIIILCVFCFYAVAQKSNTTEEKIPKEGPDILIMKQLSNQYVPVRFKHKLHIQPMAIMGIECSACHHYSSPDSFPPCRKCHSQTRNEINSTFPLSRPSLQSAYHRKCVNCHQEWSRDIIECSSCHVEKVAGESDKSRVTVAGDVDQEHPVIESSDRKIYETKYHGGTKVTFLHKEHVELFEIDCVDCHREGGCGLCHGEEKPKGAASEELERHKLCVSCHALEEDSCLQCHTNTAKQGFDHGQSTGWPLKQYHRSLKCSKCHIMKGEFSKLETECDVCHRDWNPKNFNHAVTGVALDENHREIDCKYCHADSKFDKEPSCSECHGEDIKYPESLPGSRTNEAEKK